MQVSSCRSTFNIFGSVPLKQAKVICMIYDGDNRSIWEQNIGLVNEIWADHSLLIGSVPIGETVFSSDSEISQGLKGMKALQGWDIPGISGFIKEINQKHDLIRNFEKMEMFARTAGGWSSFLTNNPTEGCKTTFDEFVKLALPMPQGEDQQDEKITGKRERLKKEIFDYLESGHLEGFEKSLRSMIALAKWHSCTLKRREIFRLRQASLKEAISAELTSDQKIIVFLEKEQLTDPDIQKFLMEKRSVAICSKLLPFPNKDELWEDPEASPGDETNLAEKSLLILRNNQNFPMQAAPLSDSPPPKKSPEPRVPHQVPHRQSSGLRKSPTNRFGSLGELDESIEDKWK